MNQDIQSLPRTDREKHWLKILEQWQSSGQTILAFCQDKKIATASFYSWRKRLQPEKSQSKISSQKTQSLFMPVQLTPPHLESRNEVKLSLQYPNGCVLHLEGQLNPQLLSCFNKAMGV